ncbi:MAG: hypothetical protein WD766_05285 [Gemmatimonadota bacterium]
MENLYRVCVKLYANEPSAPNEDAALFVPIFHEWIRDGVLDIVTIDVADYAHVPKGPGIMLVAHETAFALDRSDGAFGLMAQRRTPIGGDAVDAVATTLRQTLQVAARLEGDPRLVGRLKFDASRLRVEANDRLRAPNTDEGHRIFEPLVREAVGRVYPAREISISRILNDPRDRLALDVRVVAAADVREHLAA